MNEKSIARFIPINWIDSSSERMKKLYTNNFDSAGAVCVCEYVN